jgi:type II secretory pathway component PulF
MHSSARAGRLAGPASRPLRRLPLVGRLWRLGENSAFAELAALLLEQEIPLPNALRLAADASADDSLRREAYRVQSLVEIGADVEGTGFPPLIHWALSAPTSSKTRVDSLRRAATIYRDEFHRRAESLRLWLPLILTAAIGGAATAALALFVLGPMYLLLARLAAAA